MFDHITDPAVLKAAYRDACKRYHPDRGGSTAKMQEINAAYTARLKALSAGQQYGEGQFFQSAEEAADIEEKVRAAVEKIAHLDGLEIEIIGVWVWVGGETRTHKEALKAAGYKWASKRCKWFFAGRPARGSKATMDELRDKYGSERVATTTSRRLPKA